VNRDRANGLFKKLHITQVFSLHVVTGTITVDGHVAATPSFPNGNWEMDERVELRLMRSLRLDADEYTRLRDCTLSYEAYLALLGQRAFG
jgi:hypothetical protein